MIIIILEFVFCTSVIIFAGAKLSKYGDVIAEKTGISAVWIGALLLAVATSLPEMIAGISSVTLYDVPDIAVGGILGSCMLNIAVLSTIDIMTGRKPIYEHVDPGHVISAGFGILLLSLAAVGILAGPRIPALGWVGFPSIVLIGLYVIGMRVLLKYERRHRAAAKTAVAQKLRYAEISRPAAVLIFAVNAAAIVATGIWLPGLGESISAKTGLGQSFVGTFFIALSASLPELVVTIVAVRIGAIDLALGNLFGSNFFNVAALGLIDVLYTKAPVLTVVSTDHVITAAATVAMTALAIVGLTYRTVKQPLFLTWDTVGIVAIYFATTAVLYRMG